MLVSVFLGVTFKSTVLAQNAGTGAGAAGAAAAAAGANFAAAAPEIEQLNQGKTSSDVNQEKYSASSLGNILAETSCKLMGSSYGCVQLDEQGNVVGARGLTQSLASLTTSMYTNPPANTQTYIADLLNSSGIATPAYAQGLGFASLSPILEAWKLFRNLAYFFFVLIFLVIGIMIILRRRVGQAAITAQQAIPQIIIALLAVTFSYAIAGLLIDLMYVFMYLLVGVSGESSSLIDKNFIQLGAYLITNGLGSIGLIGGFVDASLGDAAGIIGEAVEILAEITVALIIAIAVTVGVFKLFFELLKTYVTIIISVTLAPLLLMFGAIPGRSNFMSWIKSLVGNLAAFPTVLIIMIIFQKLVAIDATHNTGFLPPYLFGSGRSGVIPALVGLGLILALPEAVKKMKQSLGASDGPFGEILQAGFDRAKAQYKYGKVVPKLAQFGAGGVAGAAGGALASVPLLFNRELSAEQKRQAARKRVGYGALGGALAVPGIPMAYRAGKGIIKTGLNQVGQAAGVQLWDEIRARRAASKANQEVELPSKPAPSGFDQFDNGAQAGNQQGQPRNPNLPPLEEEVF